MASREAAAEPGQYVGTHGLGQSSEGWAGWQPGAQRTGASRLAELALLLLPSHT